MSDTPITPEILRTRAALAGITLEAELIEGLASMMSKAVVPLASLDPQPLKQVEPAITFNTSPPQTL